VEFTVGPIPIVDNWGKEVVVRYKASSLNTNGVFETDSNGREMMKRFRNKRSADFCPPNSEDCKKSLKHEPISSNYYPVNAMISVADENLELDVLVDATHGGTSLEDGSIELMVHRRVLHDDFRGVEEPLNETMCGCGDIRAAPGQMGVNGKLGDGGCTCVGLTIRGRHVLILDSKENARATRRLLGNEIAHPIQLAFFENDLIPNRRRLFANQSAIIRPTFTLPPSVHLLTLCSNYENGTLIRFSHSFERGEHPVLSGAVKFSLKEMFLNKIKSVSECSLSANQPLAKVSESLAQRVWKVTNDELVVNEEDDIITPRRRRFLADDFLVTLEPMEVRTFWMQFEQK